jgi:hypothetical protein
MRTVSNVIAKTNLLGYAVDIEWQNPPASDFGVGASMIGIRLTIVLPVRNLDHLSHASQTAT